MPPKACEGFWNFRLVFTIHIFKIDFSNQITFLFRRHNLQVEENFLQSLTYFCRSTFRDIGSEWRFSFSHTMKPNLFKIYFLQGVLGTTPTFSKPSVVRFLIYFLQMAPQLEGFQVKTRFKFGEGMMKKLQGLLSCLAVIENQQKKQM